jgi:hypothetical protein
LRKDPAGVSQIVLAPARGEEAGVAHHLEVLVRNVADQAPDEGLDRQGLVRGLAALRVILVGEADDAALAIVVGDPVLGEHRPLGVATDVAQREAGVA